MDHRANIKNKMVGLFIIFAVIVTITLGIRHIRKVSNRKRPLPSLRLLKTKRVKQQDFVEVCPWFGKVRTSHREEIYALQAGRIVSIDARDGTHVKKGDPLFTIGGPLIDSRLKALRNRLAILKKRIVLARHLVEIKQKATSQRLARYEELASAKDALASLKSEQESLMYEMHCIEKTCHIHATVNGVFTRRRVSVGQEVQRGDVLGEIVSLDHIYIAATLFPRNGTRLEGKKASIDIDSSRSILGTVFSVLPERTAEGAVVAWIRGPKLEAFLRPGQIVKGTVLLSRHRGLAVPANAIIRDKREQAYVFVKDPSGYHRREIKTGISYRGWVEVLSGIREKDEVVTQGAYGLFYQRFNKIYKVAD